MILRRLIAVLILSLTAAQALAQQAPVFENYDEMRSQLDELIMTRQIQKVMLRFGGPTSMTEDDLVQMEEKMHALFPYDFRHVAVMRRDQMENGFSHELYAYWTGLRYLYVLALLHQRDDELVSINIRFNTDVYKMFPDM